mmetsp:Transcript_87315/g.260502  ORF Transcript_87315/g.260502 Transcript_87315/m.260502 type:complete len:220 (+) Transcript_87315:73-732(+)
MTVTCGRGKRRKASDGPSAAATETARAGTATVAAAPRTGAQAAASDSASAVSAKASAPTVLWYFIKMDLPRGTLPKPFTMYALSREGYLRRSTNATVPLSVAQKVNAAAKTALARATRGSALDIRTTATPIHPSDVHDSAACSRSSAPLCLTPFVDASTAATTDMHCVATAAPSAATGITTPGARRADRPLTTAAASAQATPATRTLRSHGSLGKRRAC